MPSHAPGYGMRASLFYSYFRIIFIVVIFSEKKKRTHCGMNCVDVCEFLFPPLVHPFSFGLCFCVRVCELVIFAMPIVFASHMNACMVWQLSKEKIRSVLFVV